MRDVIFGQVFQADWKVFQCRQSSDFLHFSFSQFCTILSFLVICCRFANILSKISLCRDIPILLIICDYIRNLSGLGTFTNILGSVVWWCPHFSGFSKWFWCKSYLKSFHSSFVGHIQVLNGLQKTRGPDYGTNIHRLPFICLFITYP